MSNSVGGDKQAIVDAIATAAASWHDFAGVRFEYVPGEDSSCDQNNTNVVFDVRPVTGQPYWARAFFPYDPRASSNVLVDDSVWADLGTDGLTLANLFAHELGHTLGFRHEHTRPEAGSCGLPAESTDWRAVTPYDKSSTMHYPWCNGDGSWSMPTGEDYHGAFELYGVSARLVSAVW